ncbi:MAG: ferrochelatase [Fibrobacter sp.]|jgi:ferrochelatase|nr:ferrochelatase [Fibrobacter sp.]
MNRFFDSVLLVQLGSPREAAPAAVEDYLLSFLGDPHTLGNPPPFWNALLKHGIAPRRSKASAKKYAAMVQAFEGSGMPLDFYTRRFAEGVARECKAEFPVFYAYQHGCSPSIQDAFTEIASRNLKSLLVVPLYPQYSGATSGAVMAQVQKVATAFPEIKVSFEPSFGSRHYWAVHIGRKIKEQWNEPTHIVVSWHGVQKKRILQGDPYQKECEQSFALIKDVLGTTVPMIQSYQSRFGFVKWLSPSTRKVLRGLGKQKARVLVVCPAFTADNLETLYEADVELREVFERSGGLDFKRVPCLNDDVTWVRDFSSALLRKV